MAKTTYLGNKNLNSINSESIHIVAILDKW